MRRRRVERCLLRASVAIEAGVLDDAREAIEEVRAPRSQRAGDSNSSTHAARRRRTSPPPVEQPRRRRNSRCRNCRCARIAGANVNGAAGCLPRLLRVCLPGLFDSPRRSSCCPAVPPVAGGGRRRSAPRPRHCRWQRTSGVVPADQRRREPTTRLLGAVSETSVAVPVSVGTRPPAATRPLRRTAWRADRTVHSLTCAPRRAPSGRKRRSDERERPRHHRPNRCRSRLSAQKRAAGSAEGRNSPRACLRQSPPRRPSHSLAPAHRRGSAADRLPSPASPRAVAARRASARQKRRALAPRLGDAATGPPRRPQPHARTSGCARRARPLRDGVQPARCGGGSERYGPASISAPWRARSRDSPRRTCRSAGASPRERRDGAGGVQRHRAVDSEGRRRTADRARQWRFDLGTPAATGGSHQATVAVAASAVKLGELALNPAEPVNAALVGV